MGCPEWFVGGEDVRGGEGEVPALGTGGACGLELIHVWSTFAGGIAPGGRCTGAG